MFKPTSRWLLSAGLLLLVLIASACFQSVGDVPEGNVVSGRITETWTPVPTDTPIPTEEFTEEAQAVDQPISEVETATPTLIGTPVAQGDGGVGGSQPDPFQLTATELIRTATQGVADQLTATALAQGIGVFTPTPLATMTIDPIFLSLTPAVGGFPTATPGIVLSGTDCVHEVVAGETMFRYSQTYGLPVNTIAAANSIVNPNVIIVGQRVVIPGCGTTGARPPATSVPVTTFGTGGVLTPNPGQGGGFTGACGGQYVVQQYDTLFQISLSCGVAVQSIANVNGITNVNYIKMGDILTIPAQ
jgi:LysM repeat protein